MNIFLSSFTGPFEVCIYVLEEISVKPWLLRFSAFSTRSTPFFHILAKSILYPFNLKKIGWIQMTQVFMMMSKPKTLPRWNFIKIWSRKPCSPKMSQHQGLNLVLLQTGHYLATSRRTANYNALLLATRDTIQFYNPFSNFRHYILCLIFAYRGISFIFRNYLIIHVSFFSGKPLKSALIHELCIIFCIS